MFFIRIPIFDTHQRIKSTVSNIGEKNNILNVKFFHCTTDVSFKSFNVDQKRQERLDSDRHSRLLSSKSYSNWWKKNIPWGLTLWLVMLSLINSIPTLGARIYEDIVITGQIGLDYSAFISSSIFFFRSLLVDDILESK